MIFGQDRAALRAVFFQAWRHHRRAETLAGVERLIVEVALRHPEYHALLDDPDQFQHRDYSPALGESNPFLHLAMHVAIEEQLSIDQPKGIIARYQALRTRLGDDHAAQHHMMECLGEMLWQAGRRGTAPDEAAFLACVGPPANT